MAESNEFVVVIRGEADQLKSALKEAQQETLKASKAMEGALGQLDGTVQKNTKSSSLAWSSFVGNIAADVAMKAFSAMKDAVVSTLSGAIDEAAQGEVALNKLQNAFRLAGISGDEAAQGFKTWADATAESVGVADDAILSAGGLIATMTKLSGEPLQKATMNALDLSAALGIDLSTASNMVAKAANGNVAALAKMGVQLVDTGDKALNGSLAMAELEKRFGGSAQAASQTFSGAMTKAGLAFQNLQEAIGLTVTQNPVVIALIDQVKIAIGEMGSWVEENQALIKEWIGGGISAVITALGVMVEMVNVGIKAIELFGIGIAGVIQASMDLNTAMVALVSGDLKGAAKAFEGTGAAIDVFKEKLAEPGRLDPLTNKIAEVGVAIDNSMGAAKTTGFKAGVEQVKNELTEAAKAALEFGNSLAKQGQDPMAEFKLRSDAMKASRELDMMTEQEYQVQRQALLVESMAAEDKILADAYATGQMTEQAHQSAILALRRNHASAAIASGVEAVNSEKKLGEERAQNMKSTLGTIATLQTSSSKELAAIGKASALATATIDGIAAVQVALKSAPPPFNFGLAALVGAATAANVAKIAGVGLASGIDSVPGGGFSDSVPAMLTPGERVVPRNTNQDLKEFLKEDQQPSNVVNVSFVLNGSINASDGEFFINQINGALARGAQRILGT